MGRTKTRRDLIEKPLSKVEQRPEFTSPDVIANFEKLLATVADCPMHDVIVCVIKCMEATNFAIQYDLVRRLGIILCILLLIETYRSFVGDRWEYVHSWFV